MRAEIACGVRNGVNVNAPGRQRVPAGLATTPFGAFHFQRIAPLTLLANLAAMPAVGLVVMPMALLA
ncbi:MAG: hypothetical protein F9K40_21815, partial [Kofleriaceae bacterium]